MKIKVTKHEFNEWQRMAEDCYNKGFSKAGNRFSVYASSEGDFDLSFFDKIQTEYREWLCFGQVNDTLKLK